MAKTVKNRPICACIKTKEKNRVPTGAKICIYI